MRTVQQQENAESHERADHAFDDWAAPHLVVMRRLATQLAPGCDPQDIAQDALVHAWRKWHRFDPARGTPRTWLLALTADRARYARTRSRPLPGQLSRFAGRRDPWVLLPEPDAGAEDHLEQDLDLRRAVSMLPLRQRQAVCLVYYVGVTVEEAATLMGCRPGTVKSTLHDARKALRARLGGDPE